DVVVDLADRFGQIGSAALVCRRLGRRIGLGHRNRDGRAQRHSDGAQLHACAHDAHGLLLCSAIRRTLSRRVRLRRQPALHFPTIRWRILVTALVLSACGGHATTPGPTTSTAPPTSSAPVAAPSTPSGPRTVKWVDLAVSECLAAIPQVDIGEVTADLVDCAVPHAAEVYL